MATFIKGNISYTPVVEQINRKFAVKAKTCSAPIEVGPVDTESATFMGGATRQSTRIGLGSVKKNYFFFRENASFREPDAAELGRRSSFIAGNAWALAASKDLAAITHNQLVWNYLREHPEKSTGGVSGRGYTMMGLLRAYAIKTLNEGGTPADNHKLPKPDGMPEA